MSIPQALEKIGQELVVKAEQELIQYNLSDSNIIKNIYAEVNELGPDMYLLTIKYPDYAVYIDGGRSAGARMPPEKPIQEYMKRKGIPLTKTFAVRKKIQIRGIPARPFLKEVADHVQNVTKILYQGAKTQIEEELLIYLEKLKRL